MLQETIVSTHCLHFNYNELWPALAEIYIYTTKRIG